MLSKVAERMYWFARYLERVENTARLVGVYDSLLFDLPRNYSISWYNLVVINSSSEQYATRYKVQDERNVVKFLLADDDNPSSMMTSLIQARENVRTTREVLPEEVWEQVNELYLYVKEHVQSGINRTYRHAFLDHIIKSCQQMVGLLAANMSKDAGWQFIRLGRNLERADMTTRLLDAGSAALLSNTEEDQLDTSQLIWGNVLRSCSAAMNYRRTVRSQVTGPDVATFLLQDPAFPRSLLFCTEQMQDAIKALPECCVDKIEELNRLIEIEIDHDDQLGESFRDHLNELQLVLADLHGQFAHCWFAAE
ncbi:alpha-E domain-containing protein [Pontibacter sp. JAM-7]|uniref:alpha-E domain-containing protein n=1 Tax=Pontibacter sp. JAM-7 TaxID=3366581 RepID=UPI003AF448D3